MRASSATVMVIVFESAILKATLSQLYSKFLLKNCDAHSKPHFERNPTFEDSTDMDQDTC